LDEVGGILEDVDDVDGFDVVEGEVELLLLEVFDVDEFVLLLGEVVGDL
jgi:hypothetical protein